MIDADHPVDDYMDSRDAANLMASCFAADIDATSNLAVIWYLNTRR